MAHCRAYANPQKTTRTISNYPAGSRSILQNETGSGEEKWHKTDTSGSASVRNIGEKENAAPAGPRNGIIAKQKSAFSAPIISTTCSGLKAESSVTLDASDTLAELDRAVFAALAMPDGRRRNGWLCFSRRSQIAREVGVRRDVLNASIRRLEHAGLVRPVYSAVLGRWGLEIGGAP